MSSDYQSNTTFHSSLWHQAMVPQVPQKTQTQVPQGYLLQPPDDPRFYQVKFPDGEIRMMTQATVFHQPCAVRAWNNTTLRNGTSSPQEMPIRKVIHTQVKLKEEVCKTIYIPTTKQQLWSERRQEQLQLFAKALDFDQQMYWSLRWAFKNWMASWVERFNQLKEFRVAVHCTTHNIILCQLKNDQDMSAHANHWLLKASCWQYKFNTGHINLPANFDWSIVPKSSKLINRRHKT